MDTDALEKVKRRWRRVRSWLTSLARVVKSADVGLPPRVKPAARAVTWDARRDRFQSCADLGVHPGACVAAEVGYVAVTNAARIAGVLALKSGHAAAASPGLTPHVRAVGAAGAYGGAQLVVHSGSVGAFAHERLVRLFAAVNAWSMRPSPRPLPDLGRIAAAVRCLTRQVVLPVVASLSTTHPRHELRARVLSAVPETPALVNACVWSARWTRRDALRSMLVDFHADARATRPLLRLPPVQAHNGGGVLPPAPRGAAKTPPAESFYVNDAQRQNHLPSVFSSSVRERPPPPPPREQWSGGGGGGGGSAGWLAILIPIICIPF